MNKVLIFISFFLLGNFFIYPQDIYVSENFSLSGTLLKVNSPNSDLVIFVSGSGPTDRDGNNPSFKNNSLKMLSEKLYDKGISSFRYDKRGVGLSVSGLVNENELRFSDYVDDLNKIISYFSQLKAFKSITILGHSEGSLIGMISSKSTSIDKFISIAGMADNMLNTIQRQLSIQPKYIKSMSIPILDKLKNKELTDSVPPLLMTLFRPSVQPYLIEASLYDPIIEIAKLDIPVLIIQGDNDIQIEVDDASRLNKAAINSELKIINGMNHILKQASNNRLLNMQTYANPNLPIDKNLVQFITEFIYKK